MGWGLKAVGIVAVVAGLGGCAAPDPFAIKTLPKGERVDVRDVIAANPGRSVCTDYEAKTQSCASVITAVIKGNTLIAREIGMVRLPEAGAAQRVEIVSRSTLRDGQACAKTEDFSSPGRDEVSKLLVEISRDLVNQSGGTVCASYFRSGEGYVVSSTGADGAPFARGDVYLQYIDGPPKLRLQ